MSNMFDFFLHVRFIDQNDKSTVSVELAMGVGGFEIVHSKDLIILWSGSLYAIKMPYII